MAEATTLSLNHETLPGEMQKEEIILNGIRPLSTVQRGQFVTVVRHAAGKRVNHRLLEMGLTPGVEVQVKQNNGGPLLLAVRGSRLAIGRCMAHKIIVGDS